MRIQRCKFCSTVCLSAKQFWTTNRLSPPKETKIKTKRLSLKTQKSTCYSKCRIYSGFLSPRKNKVEPATTSGLFQQLRKLMCCSTTTTIKTPTSSCLGFWTLSMKTQSRLMTQVPLWVQRTVLFINYLQESCRTHSLVYSVKRPTNVKKNLQICL